MADHLDEIEEITQRLRVMSAGQGDGTQSDAAPIQSGSQTNTGAQGSEHRSEPLDEDDMPGLSERGKSMFGTVLRHLKALQTAVSVPMFDVVHKFDRDSRNFRTWTLELERYQQIAKLTDGDLPQIAHLTCTGPVADYIKRHLQDMKTRKQKVSWAILKILLGKRFGDDTDSHQALALLRQISQKQGEPVQLYGEGFLKVAELAYPERHTHKETQDFI
jgi:hypothetical protein